MWRCISRRRSPWPQLSRTWSRSRWSRIEFSVRSIEATAAVDRARQVQLIELAVCGRCPAKLSFLPAVTGHTWRENAPKVLKKWGWWVLPGSRRLGHLVLILGRRADHHMIFHIFSIPFLPWVFRRRLFKVLRKKKWNPLYVQCSSVKTCFVHACGRACARVCERIFACTNYTFSEWLMIVNSYVYHDDWFLSIHCAFLKIFQNLRSVKLKLRSSVTSLALCDFLRSSGVRLQVLWLDDSPCVNDDVVSALVESCPRLKQLHLGSCARLSQKSALMIQQGVDRSYRS